MLAEMCQERGTNRKSHHGDGTACTRPGQAARPSASLDDRSQKRDHAPGPTTGQQEQAKARGGLRPEFLLRAIPIIFGRPGHIVF